MTSSAPRCVRTATAIPIGASTISGTMHGHDVANAVPEQVRAMGQRSGRDALDGQPVLRDGEPPAVEARRGAVQRPPGARGRRRRSRPGRSRAAPAAGEASRARRPAASQMHDRPAAVVARLLDEDREARRAHRPRAGARRACGSTRSRRPAEPQAAGSADSSSPFAANPSMRGPTESTATSAPATRPVRRSATRATSSATTLARPAPHTVASARTAQACGPNRSNAPRYRRSRPCGRSTQTSR